jgi:hypothetical protein
MVLLLKIFCMGKGYRDLKVHQFGGVIYGG